MLRASQVLTHVAHLLRSGLKYNQKRSAKDGSGRVWLPLKMRQGDDGRARSKKIVVLLSCKKKDKKNDRGIINASSDLVRQIGSETVRILRELSHIRKPVNRKSIEHCANIQTRGARTVVRARVVS